MTRLIYPSSLNPQPQTVIPTRQTPKINHLHQNLNKHSVKLNILIQSQENLLIRRKPTEKAHLSLEQKVAEGSEGAS